MTDIRVELGERPIWSRTENVVYWIDIHGRKLHRTAPDTRTTKSIDLPSRSGMIALRKKGGLVVVSEDGRYACEPGSGALDLLVPLEPDVPENRPNDGKRDAAGRLWVGTMNLIEEGRPTGNFYRIDPDPTVTKIASGLGIPNGLAWSPDDKVMLHTDTCANVVWHYEFDPATGKRHAEQTLNRPSQAGPGGALTSDLLLNARPATAQCAHRSPFGFERAHHFFPDKSQPAHGHRCTCIEVVASKRSHYPTWREPFIKRAMLFRNLRVDKTLDKLANDIVLIASGFY